PKRPSHHPARFSGSRTGSVGTAVRSVEREWCSVPPGAGQWRSAPDGAGNGLRRPADGLLVRSTGWLYVVVR
ncbi:hypothetical protein AB0P37_14140, partial [Streptomyces antimycoticus]|uniref:hypothetical protein n=1 Tax=Streptomyces antimycoticus TaxID=68175 RepID=UPI003421ABC5